MGDLWSFFGISVVKENRGSHDGDASLPALPNSFLRFEPQKSTPRSWEIRDLWNYGIMELRDWQKNNKKTSERLRPRAPLRPPKMAARPHLSRPPPLPPRRARGTTGTALSRDPPFSAGKGGKGEIEAAAAAPRDPHGSSAAVSAARRYRGRGGGRGSVAGSDGGEAPGRLRCAGGGGGGGRGRLRRRFSLVPPSVRRGALIGRAAVP